MPTIVTSQAIFPFYTGIPRDVITNTFHFLWDEEVSDKETVATEINARLDTFYTYIYDVYSANYINFSNGRSEHFFQFEPTPRVPVVRTLAVDVTESTSTIPTEVACVVSFHAAPVSGVDRRRLHNRIYLGGLRDAITASSTTSFPVFSTAFLTRVTDAAEALLAGNTGALDWVQHSTAGGSPATRTIVGGWVDNSPDTQRRRSVNASVRTLWS